MHPIRLALVVIAAVAWTVEAHSFTISPDGSTFLLDAEPVQLFSGSVHYFRSLPDQWPDRLRAARAMGLNAVQTYVPWNFHMPDNETTAIFDGARDLERFLTLAKEADLHVLLRVGPYICAEWDFGGFPAWLLKYDRHMRVRTMDPVYMRFVRQWWERLLPIVRKHLITEGGPVVMVQVENEYGSFGNDTTYLKTLRDWARELLGNDILLYSTDADEPHSTGNTAMYGVFQAIDFFYYGTRNENVSAAWVRQHKHDNVSLKGPNMNDEFYPGWLTQWGDSSFIGRSADYVLRTVKAMLASNASFNFYMFHGGTNFGFWPGQIVVTSYDYSAPLTEPGDPRIDKYMPLRSLLASYPWNKGRLPPVPHATIKKDFGVVNLTLSVSLLDALWEIPASNFSHIVNGTATPLGMEGFGQSYGFISYEFAVPPQLGPWTLSLGADPNTAVADYVLVFCDGVFQGFLLRGHNSSLTMDCGGQWNSDVKLIIESVGRANFGRPTLWSVSKGLTANPIVNGTVLPQYGYTVLTLPMTAALINQAPFMSRHLGPAPTSFRPAFFKGNLTIAADEELADTFLDMRGWGKGFVLVNGFNIGRYWSVVGPQYSLYCPKSILRHGANEVIVFEQRLAALTGDALIRFSNYSYNLIPHNPYAPPTTTP